MKNLFFFSFFLLLCLGCTKQKEQIEYNYKTLKSAIKTGRTDYMVQNIDAESIAYFSRIVELVNEGSNYKKDSFCKEIDYPLTTRIILHVAEMLSDRDSVSTGLNIEEVISIAELSGAGFLNILEIDRFSFDKVNKAWGSEATATINYKLADNTYMQSTFLFHKEDGKWKLNVPSTFSFREKYLSKEWDRLGGSQAAFAEAYIKEGGKSKYMLRYKN